MITSALVKGSFAVVAVSGVATTGAYFYGAFDREDKSFSNYLSKIGRISASSKEDWSRLKELYVSDSNSDLILNISKDDIKSGVKFLSDWCGSKLKSNYKDSEKNLVESWCSKAIKISDRLSYFGLLALNTSETGSPVNADDAIWTDKVGKYGGDIGKNVSLKVNEISDPNGIKTLGQEISSGLDNGKLKKWCDWAKDQDYKHGESVLFKRYRHWCTKKKG